MNPNKLSVLDKYTQKQINEVKLLNANEIETVIERSETVFKETKTWSAGRRASMLKRLLELVLENKKELINLIVSEAGKPITYAESEFKRSLMTLEIAIEKTKYFSGEIVPMDFDQGEGRTAFTKRFPIGPVLCITPFNFPLNLVLHKIAPALAVGCTAIVKPAPQAPLTALMLEKLIEQAGYPKDAVQVVNCDNELSESMVRDNRVKMLSFTGSEKIGWYLKSISQYKKVTLELGGNAAVIIQDVQDLALAAKKVAIGAFLYSGQICISTQRIFVQKELKENFTEFLIKEIKLLKTGNPTDSKTIMSSLIDKKSFLRVDKWVNEARDGGGKILVGGKIINADTNEFAATLIETREKDLKVYSEEVFGPVAVIDSYTEIDEAIELVNDSKYGLQVGVFTQNINVMKKCHEEIEVAGVLINDIPGFRIDNMPYGGIKMSGLGREGLEYAMEEMTEPRLLVF